MNLGFAHPFVLLLLPLAVLPLLLRARDALPTPGHFHNQNPDLLPAV